MVIDGIAEGLLLQVKAAIHPSFDVAAQAALRQQQTGRVPTSLQTVTKRINMGRCLLSCDHHGSLFEPSPC
jgi:hypothetical protein